MLYATASQLFPPLWWAGSPDLLPSLPQLVPSAVPRFWELGTFEGGTHRGRAGTAVGASAAGPRGAECRVGEPFTEWLLCPALPDARPPPAAWIRAHCTCLHPELHPRTIPGREGTGRRVSKSHGFLSLAQVMGGKASGLTWRTHGPILDLDGRDGVYREDFLRRWLEGQSPSGPRITAPCLALQTPTLILYGELDRVLAWESLRQLRHLPNHSVVKLRDAGHACYLHKPQDFHLVLLAFLDHLP